MRALKLAPHRTSCEKDTAGHVPRKTEKRYLGSKLLDLEGGVVSGGVSQVFEWMNVEIPSLFASVAQSTSQLFLLLVGPFIYSDLFAALPNLGKTPPKWHSPYVNAHETPTRFLHPEDKKWHVRGCRRRGRRRLGR